MSKVVLCIENGNARMEETKKELRCRGCKIYTLREEEAGLHTMLEEIERTEGKVDLLLLGVNERIPEDGAIGEKHDCSALLERLGEQINRMQEAIEAALPLLRKGELKRIGMITKKESSIGYCRDDRNYGRHMAWAGCNMVGRIYFNLLRSEGFTFRWYCAENDAGGMTAGEYFLSGLCYDPKEPYLHSDENRFVMRDSHLREIPW